MDSAFSGIEALGDIPWGSHFCHFYHNHEDLIETLVPFFKAGLENKEKCIWITSDPLRVTDAQELMRQAVPGFASILNQGQIEIRDYKEWYRRSEANDAESVLESWIGQQKRALENGYSGLRLTGDTYWLERHDWQSFADYEATVSQAFSQHRIIGLCSYCLGKTNSAAVFDVARSHHFALLRHERGWDLLESSKMRNSNGHLKKLNEELRSNLKLARDSAESANRLKTAFLANMSHEIRTPLGAILGFTELLRDHDVADEEKRLYIDTIQRNGSALARLIDDILDLSKIEADRLELEKVAFSLPALINEITSLFAARAERAGIPLIVSFDQRVPTQIISDPTRIRQILINLIGNALKFTEHGEIMLKIAPIEDAAGNIQFSVEDSGVGIPIERQSGLFQPFVQADCSTTRKFGGTGLGLFLSKRLAQALGGDVRLTHSEPGVGSKFVLMLACGTAEAEKASQSHGKGAHPAPMQRLKGSRILLVEDTIDNQLLVGRILKRQGAELEFASDGKAGVDKALAGKFDIVLMDLQMPEMDGFEALNTLRENGFTKPIVALTAHAMKEERRHALASGFAEHVAKPVNSSELISVLESFLTTNV